MTQKRQSQERWTSEECARGGAEKLSLRNAAQLLQHQEYLPCLVTHVQSPHNHGLPEMKQVCLNRRGGSI